MNPILHDARLVRDATLRNTTEASYVVPADSTVRDSSSDLLKLPHPSSSHSSTSASLRLSLSNGPIVFKLGDVDSPGLRRTILPTPPLKGNPSRAPPLCRHRLRQHEIEASATAAASTTHQRRHQQQQEHQSLPLPFRGHAGPELLQETWQPSYLHVDFAASPEASTARTMAKVTSPHTAPSAPLVPELHPNAIDRSKKRTASAVWRLRRRNESITNALSVFSSPSSISSLLDRKKNPLDALRRLGATIFNDAPLHTFLPTLDLRMPFSRLLTSMNSTATEVHMRESAATVTAELSRRHNIRETDRRRRRSSRQRNDAVTIHLGDVEARTFRVDVIPGEESPVKAVAEAHHWRCWDGTEFLLVPLEDEPHVSLEAVSPLHRMKEMGQQLFHDDDSMAPSGGLTASLSFDRESQTGLDLPSMPATFLRSANNGFQISTANVEDNRPVDGQASSSSVSAGAATTAGANVVVDTPVFGKAAERATGEAEVNKSAVPCWKRFCTTAALYLMLGDAGCCDTTYFPFSSVQLCTWGDLVAQPQTRIEMMASCTVAAIYKLHVARYEKRTEPIPVAVMLPTTRKGVMRSPFSITTQPFSDAEVFQLFYLQLVFRAYFDVRFPSLGFRVPGQAEWHLRSDFIAVRSSGNHCVAFGHPVDPNVWIRFPAHTRLLTLLCLKEAIVPLYATPSELQESAMQPLFGSGDALPCLGALGHALAQWAATVEVTSPASAMEALTALFDKMGTRYCSTRAELWKSTAERHISSGANATNVPLLFRCSVATVGAVLYSHGGTLARFFVPPEKRWLSLPSTNALNHTVNVLNRTTGRASAELSTTLPTTTRQTHLSCMRGESSEVNTTLPTAAATPQQPFLNDMVLGLNWPDAERRSSGVTDVLTSTTGGSQMMNHSHTKALSSTFDVVHPSALLTTDNGASIDKTKLLSTSFTQAGDVAPAGTLGFSSHVAAVLPSVKMENRKKRAELEVSPLLSSSAETLKVGELFAASINMFSQGTEKLAGSCSLNARTESQSFIGAASPFTKQESLVTRWRYYMESGNCDIFDGVTAGIKLFELRGRGGSGFVYQGTYGSRHLPVAVKVFIIPDGMPHERYVRESLTDVAFYVLANQLNDYGISYNGRAHDFIVSSVAPEGLPLTDAKEARRGGDSATTKLCYFVTDLMDGTIGRFLDSNDDDFDPMYDQLVNSPLQEGELFQFLFNQLAFKTLFDWRVLDMMLNNHLRGDNIGYRYVSLPPERAVYLREHPEEAAALALTRQYYAGVLYAFQFSPEESVKYLRFPAAQANGSSRAGAKIKGDETPMRLICIIDVGQGTQPNVAELVRRGFIGETVVESCMQDDGLGRYWPLDELYCRYVDVKGTLSKEVVAWGSTVRINAQEDAFNALQELFLKYYPTYGVDSPTEEELRTYLSLSWTPRTVADLKAGYAYRRE